MEFISNMDISIIEHINSWNVPVLDNIMAFITTLGNSGFIWIMIGVGMLFFAKTRGIGLTTLVALLLMFIMVEITLKPIVGRTRPFLDFNTIELFIKAPKGYSFPSGHASSSFAAATALYLSFKKSKYEQYGYLALLLATLIAFSRVYLCVHYPSDVLAGSIIGIFIGTASYFIYGKLNKGLKGLKKEVNN